MFSVTSDLAASLSVQTAPPKPARPDPSQSSDSFAALVDSNTAVDANSDHAPLPTPDRPAPPRPADEASATTDHRSRRNVSSTDQTTPQNNASDRDNNQAIGSNTAATSDGSAEASQPPGTESSGKSGGKLGTSKVSSKSDASADSPADQSAAAKPDDISAVITLNGIAAAIPVAIAPASAAVTSSASTNPAPLAIAAAAIAASSSAPAVAAGATSTQPKDGSAATPAATTSATVTAAPATTGITVEAAVTAKATVPAAAGDATATLAKQAAGQTDTPAAANPSLAAFVETAAPVAAKTVSAKATVAAEAKPATSSASTTTTDASDKATPATSPTPVLNNAAPQPAATAKPEAGNGLSETAKPDISDGASLSIAATGRDRTATGTTGSTSAAASDTAPQATASLQPQLPLASTGPASNGPLSVTTATGAAVPVSGLALEIAASVKSGKTRFEIRLDPADLGRIDVRIDVDRSGQVTSHLTVEKPETLSMLQQDAPQLQRALDDAGLKTGSGGLQFSLRDQSSSGGNSGNETTGNAQRLVISDDDAIPAAIAGRSYGRMLSASGGVDIRV